MAVLHGLQVSDIQNCVVLEVLKWLPFITQQRRSYSGVFAGKYGLITLRDLFRWAERYRKSENAKETFYDWEQHLAEDGMCYC